MAIRNIRLHGDNILRKVAKPVELFDDKLHTLLNDMLDTLRKHNGMGIAAPQVGVLKRIAMVEIEKETDTKKKKKQQQLETEYGFYELINPVIVETEGETQENEACLSLPGKNAPLARPDRIVVQAVDRQGTPYTVVGTGVMARAMCHEIDHLDGIMYVDLIEPGTLRDNKDGE